VDKIVYHRKMNLDITELNDELEIDSSESDSLTNDMVEFRDMLIEMTGNQNLLESTYIFNQDRIYYQRNKNKLSEDEFILIDPNSLLWTHYFTDKNGNKKFRETLYLPPESWNLEYRVNINRSDKKNILGYECYKIIITEIRSDKEDNWLEEYVYECYVTGELDLPFYCVNLVWEKIVDKTPLEIKYYKKDKPNSIQIETAISITKTIDKSALEIPNKFKKATKVKQ